jgi:predicted transcriptional regulator
VKTVLKFVEPAWLIEKLFTVGALVGLYGPSGEGKTFLALDWALSIARGGEWLGRSVQQGSVIYVAAECGRSIRKRVAAWMQHRDCPTLPEAFFILEAVQVADEGDLELLAGRLEDLSNKPTLIVLDTLARCFVGGDENSAQEMGAFVEGLAWLQQETGAAVIVLHHTGKQGAEIERGSSALRAALDTMIRVRKSGHRLITVSNNKQKDAEEFPDIKLSLQPVVVNAGTAAETTSCVLVPRGVATGVDEDVVPAHLKKTLTALESLSNEPVTRKQWAGLAGLPDRTLDQHRQDLVASGYVEQVQRGAYKITEKGRTALGTVATATKLHLVHGGR